MLRRSRIVEVRNGKRMAGNISVDDMISRILMGESTAEIAKDAGITPSSICRVFRSETGSNMKKYQGLGRWIQDQNKNCAGESILLDMLEQVKNGDPPRKIASTVGLSLGRPI